MKKRLQNIENNPFEEKENAREWINAIETIDTKTENSRVTDVYPFLENWIKEVKPKTVVEIGSGQGICSDKLGEFKGHYIGIEPSKYLIQRAHELYRHKPNREFLVGDAYSTPLNDGIADAVFSVCVWFHLNDLHKAAREVSRILKPGGAFLIITGHPDSYDLWRSFFQNLEEKDNKLIGTFALDGGTIYNIIFIHTDDDLTQSLESAGLTIDSKVGMGYKKKHDDQGIFIAIKGHKM